MGWSIGYDANWHRDIGYGVPAWCDHPECREKIDRGLSYVCGGDVKGGEHGCGLYFCSNHLHYDVAERPAEVEGKSNVTLLSPQLCARCIELWWQSTEGETTPFDPKPEHPEWIRFKLSDPSWAQWRRETPLAVRNLRQSLREQTVIRGGASRG